MNSQYASTPPPEQRTHPLSIRHFLYWTAGVAVAIWWKYGNDLPEPKNLAGVLLVASTTAYCVATGGSVAFLVWLIGCRFIGHTAPLQDPGARYATILGISMLFAMIGSASDNWLSIYADANPEAWYDWWCQSILIHAALEIAIIVFGIIWIGGISWRIALGCSLLFGAFSALDALTMLDYVPSPATKVLLQSDAMDWIRDTLHYIPIFAVITSILAEWRRKISRDWPHYFGIVLCAVMTLEFAFVQIVLAILSFNRS